MMRKIQVTLTNVNASISTLKVNGHDYSLFTSSHTITIRQLNSFPDFSKTITGWTKLFLAFIHTLKEVNFGLSKCCPTVCKMSIQKVHFCPSSAAPPFRSRHPRSSSLASPVEKYF